MLGKTESKMRRQQLRTRCLESSTESMDMNCSKVQEVVEDRRAWCATVPAVARTGHDLAPE